ncbi:hypothetical protein GB931_19985 [Modestobacter sp. I12A-02628]|uniref:Uncharacterized protein n=1 Tax=Goekera deserti TaxID=2497753 RepID=A0A7K3W8K6_9ACTN|nr:hypothetical protein [Goekera deserti]MPR00154.1 hypothetical protein [Goekera deserti]NDI49328.1 hypothetical protein [Goekera deserti]NEL52798.1 hypothetical protein [Goekera deserti]
MTLDLPDAVPLPDPPGSPQLLGDVVDGVRAAALDAWVLDVRLAAPVAATPGWQGTDAEAAAVQLATTRVVAGDLYLALSTGATRLDRHRELMEDVRAQLSALREEQDADRAVCAARMPSTAGVELATDPTLLASAQVVRDGYRERDAGRATRHADLVQELADDATAAAAELTTALAPVSGGARGAAAVTAHLAGVLPGWGTPELTDLGFEAASALVMPQTAEDLSATAAEYAAYLDEPAFAVALIARLGVDGLVVLLQRVGCLLPDRDDVLPGVLGRVLGAAARGDGRAASAVLTATVLPTDARSTGSVADRDVMAGMARVLCTGWVSSATAAAWTRQALDREQALQRRGADPEAVPPAGLVEAGLTQLARDPAAAAAFLDQSHEWRHLLGRPWSDGAASLSSVLVAVRQSDPALTEAVALAALQGAGGSLQSMLDGTGPGDRTQEALAVLSGDVAVLLASHLDAIEPLLVAGAGGLGVPSRALTPAELQVVRGIGLVAIDSGARETLMLAVTSRAMQAPVVAGADLRPASYAQGSFVAAVAGGEHVADQLHVLGRRRSIEAGQRAFAIATMPLGFLPGKTGDAVGKLFALAAPLLAPEDLSGVVGEALELTPSTGAADAKLMAIAAALPGLVAAGALPDPGPDASPAELLETGSSYEARLPIGVRVSVWDAVRGTAADGYGEIAQQLGLEADDGDERATAADGIRVTDN